MELERRLDDLTAPESIASSGGEFNLNQLWNLAQIYSSNDAGKKPTWYTCRSRLPIYTIVQDGDDLNLFEITGWDGVKFKTAARIGATVEGAPALNSVPGKIVLSTTKVGDAGPTDRMTIHNSGQISMHFATQDLHFYDAGSVGATELYWIQVQVDGGILGYIRVHATK
jgi:hypothetical protein